MNLSTMQKNIIKLGLRLGASFMLLVWMGKGMLLTPGNVAYFLKTTFPNAHELMVPHIPILAWACIISGLLILTGYKAKLGALISIFTGFLIITLIVVGGYGSKSIMMFAELIAIQAVILYVGPGDYSLSRWLDKE